MDHDSTESGGMHGSADERSADALSARRRRYYWILAAAFAVFAAYGSLVPLRYEPLPLAAAVDAFRHLADSPLRTLSRTDLAVNVALFVPIGFCLLGALSLGRSWRAAAWTLPFVVAGCLVLSISIEFAQLWFPGRTCSMYDILAQVLGTGLGIGIWLFAGTALTDWLASLAADRRGQGYVDWLLAGYYLALTLYLLWPLNLSISPVELARKYRNGRIVLRPFAEGGGVQLVLDSLTHAAAMIPVGMLAAVLFTSRARPLRGKLGSIALGVVLVGLIFAAQGLVLDRVTKTSDLVTGAIGMVIGVLAMHWWRRDEASNDTLSAAPTARTHFWWFAGLALVYSIVLFFLFCAPFDPIDDPQLIRNRLADFFRAPLAALYRGSIVNAAKEVVRKGLLFVPFGVLAALAVTSLRLPARVQRLFLLAVVLLSAGLAMLIEMAQVLLPPHVPDLTDVVLCTAGAAVGVYAATLRDRRQPEAGSGAAVEPSDAASSK